MKWQTSTLQTRLYIIAVIIMLTGLGSALVINHTAKNNSDSVLGF